MAILSSGGYAIIKIAFLSTFCQGPSSTVNISNYIYDANGTLIRNPRTHYYNSTDGGLITDNPNTWTEPPTLKSIYDPCPYGYRVPPLSSFSGFPGECPAWIPDVSGGWLTNSSWWHAVGSRPSSLAGLSGAGGFSLILSCHADPVWWGHHNSLYFTSAGDVSHYGFNQRSDGFAVRCIPE